MPEQDRHHRVRRHDVERQVARLLLPEQLVPHRPQHVHPVRAHRAADDHEPDEIGRRVVRAIHEHVGAQPDQRQHDVEDQPPFLAHVHDEPRVRARRHRPREQPPSRRSTIDWTIDDGLIGLFMLHLLHAPSHEIDEHVLERRLALGQLDQPDSPATRAGRSPGRGRAPPAGSARPTSRRP